MRVFRLGPQTLRIISLFYLLTLKGIQSFSTS